MVINTRAIFCLLLFFVGTTLHTKTSTIHSLFAAEISNYPPPHQIHYERTCYHNCRGDEDEEIEQDENWGGVCCKGQGSTVGEDHKCGTEQENKERGGGMCLGCGG